MGPLRKQDLLIGPNDSKRAFWLVVAILAQAVGITVVKQARVVRQYKKGRVCMVLQVYFITQLQHISELKSMNWVSFTLPGFCTLCVPEWSILLASPTQTLLCLPLAVNKCRNWRTKTPSMPVCTRTQRHTLTALCISSHMKAVVQMVTLSWSLETAICQRCFEVEASSYMLGMAPWTFYSCCDWTNSVTWASYL